MEHGPWSAIAQKDRGEENSMEVDIILAHELEQSDVLGIEPPLLPFGCVVCGDTRVSNGRVELWAELRCLFLFAF